MTTGEYNGKAVQILRISDDNSFQLNESQLEAILLDDRIKDKPVAVVSVAGAYRQGKSFLLSFLLRYLRNNCRSDWLGDPRTPLGGFEWSPGSRPHTTGILIWSEVFIVTKPHGEKVAVLLMDTQGSFDCNSTVKDCTTIFALSIMTSSVQVYNVLRNIQEDQLQHLQFFAEYGRLAQKGTTRQAFQRLVFLVRDWAFPYEADYGAMGGRTILNERLQIRNEQHGELQMLRKQIWSCFSQVDCFLMPRPGDKVATDMSFDGCLHDVDEKFKQKMQELVPWLLCPENLVIKKINGQNITCEELMNYFRVYARAFQGGTLPEPRSVLRAAAEASNLAAKEKATRFYMQCIERMPRGNLDELQDTHIILLEEAAELFKSAPRVGSEEASQRYLENLTMELLAYFDHIYKEQELFILRDMANEEQRQVEREIERQREEERQIERRREKQKREQEDWERAFELEREMHMEMEGERKREEELKRETERQREIEHLRDRIAQAERDRDQRASQPACIIS